MPLQYEILLYNYSYKNCATLDTGYKFKMIVWEIRLDVI